MDKGQRLKKLRESKHLSQTEAARHIGVSKQTLYKYENNIISNIPSDVIERIATLYETTPAYIMGWDKDSVAETEAELEKKARELYAKIEKLSPEQMIAFEKYLEFLQSQS